MHDERSKQHGRRFPFRIFEMVTLTRRLRVSGSLVAFTQRTHSQRAIGVMSIQRPRIFRGAAASADARSLGTLGSGQSFVDVISILTVSPALTPPLRRSFPSTFIQWPNEPSGSSTAWNGRPFIVPATATCPREGSPRLAFFGSRRMSHFSTLPRVVSKRTVATP